jgi:hypothetical protein
MIFPIKAIDKTEIRRRWTEELCKHPESLHAKIMEVKKLYFFFDKLVCKLLSH